MRLPPARRRCRAFPSIQTDWDRQSEARSRRPACRRQEARSRRLAFRQPEGRSRSASSRRLEVRPALCRKPAPPTRHRPREKDSRRAADPTPCRLTLPRDCPSKAHPSKVHPLSAFPSACRCRQGETSIRQLAGRSLLIFRACFVLLCMSDRIAAGEPQRVGAAEVGVGQRGAHPGGKPAGRDRRGAAGAHRGQRRGDARRHVRC